MADYTEFVFTSAEWDFIRPLIPVPENIRYGFGRPRVPDKPILEAIFWILRTGARWKDLPDHFPDRSTCHRRFMEWTKAGFFECLFKKVVRKMNRGGNLALRECFIDGTFSAAKKGARSWGDEKGQGNEDYGHNRWQRVSH